MLMSSDTPINDSPASARRWGPRVVLVLLGAVVVPVGVSILYTFPPTQYAFYPPCYARLLLGVHCAGCGATRSLHALLHGDIAQAFAFNPLFVLALPFLSYAGGCVLYETWTGRRAPSFLMQGWALKVLMVVLVVYSIARNVDVYPLNLLAPHEI